MAISLPAVRRSRDDRIIAGVASGIARALGVDVVVVRVAFGLLVFAGGLGAIAYLALALFLPEAGHGEPVAVTHAESRTLEQAIGVGLVTLGFMLLLRRAGVLLPDEVVWPASIVVVGVAIAWGRLDGRSGDLLDGGRGVVLRLVAGTVLLAGGIGAFVALNERVVIATQVVVAVSVTAAGVGLLAGPWIVRLGRQLSDERAERIRADERAEMAAHLHDSVLQTLAMIQRRASSPAETIALARRQERELREWLNGERRAESGATLATALRSLADEVEADHLIAVEVVVVGDAPLDADMAALVAAVREATLNVAEHSGAGTASVYVEVSDASATAYVRDRGCGFRPEQLPDGRHGLAESVIGRMQRHGGTAEVWSEPGEGTEITLAVPRAEAAVR